MISIFGCDPGLDIFGFSTIEWDQEFNTFRYITSNHICTEPNQPTIQRTRQILKELKSRASTLRGKVVYVIEKPQEALYGGEQKRVQNVLKLFAITYAVIGALADQVVFTIYPHDWQPSKGVLKEQGLTVKKWSRLQADMRIKNLNVKRKPFKTKDQDIADAVNICFYGVKKFHLREWVL